MSSGYTRLGKGVLGARWTSRWPGRYGQCRISWMGRARATCVCSAIESHTRRSSGVTKRERESSHGQCGDHRRSLSPFLRHLRDTMRYAPRQNGLITSNTILVQTRFENCAHPVTAPELASECVLLRLGLDIGRGFLTSSFASCPRSRWHLGFEVCLKVTLSSA